jgi:hypothetical protein
MVHDALDGGPRSNYAKDLSLEEGVVSNLVFGLECLRKPEEPDNGLKFVTMVCANTIVVLSCFYLKRTMFRRLNYVSVFRMTYSVGSN